MQNLVEIVSQGNIACAQIPKATEGCTTVNTSCQEGYSLRQEKVTFTISQSFLCAGSLPLPPFNSWRHWLWAFLLSRFKKQVQNKKKEKKLVQNSTSSLPQRVPSLCCETRQSKGLSSPRADPGGRRECESFLPPSFCLLERSLAGSLSFLICSLTVISAAHVLSFFCLFVFN